MTIARDTTNENIKPATKQNIINRYTSGAAIDAGEAVYLDSSGYAQPTNAGAVATNDCQGIALNTVSAAGQKVDVLEFGPVVCMTGATPGSLVYTIDTAGEFDHTGGTKKTIIGTAKSATVLNVHPRMVDLS